MALLRKDEIEALNLLLDDNANLAEVANMLRRPAYVITDFLTESGRLFRKDGKLYLFPSEPWMSSQEAKQRQDKLKKLGQGVYDEYPNYGKTWAKEDEASLVTLFFAGDPVDKMARQLGRPATALAARLAAKGLLVQGRYFDYYAIPEKPWASNSDTVAASNLPKGLEDCQLGVEDILRQRCTKLDSVELADLMGEVSRQVMRAYYLGGRDAGRRECAPGAQEPMSDDASECDAPKT